MARVIVGGITTLIVTWSGGITLLWLYYFCLDWLLFLLLRFLDFYFTALVAVCCLLGGTTIRRGSLWSLEVKGLGGLFYRRRGYVILLR
jgi:hypothetical protein